MEGKREAEALLGRALLDGKKKRDRERKKEDRRSGNAFKALLDGIKGKEKEMKSKEKGEKRL